MVNLKASTVEIRNQISMMRNVNVTDEKKILNTSRDDN